ncbi:MAG: metal-sensitive transcriptional regulator [Chloroflexi bacterium]|nr:metal-sensitive transcriptional regulator [Chloroflexota bacterium]
MFRRKKGVEPEAPYLEPELLSELQGRLSRIEGHVRGVARMLEEHRPCDDILTQVAGVRAAVEQVAIKLLEGHLDSCVAAAIRGGDGEPHVGRFKASLERVLR